MKRLRRTSGLLALAETAIAGSSLPYNPARLFVPANSSSAYIFQPSADNQFSFGTIDFTKPFDGSNQSVNSISNTLPFLDNKKSISFTPVLNGGGNFTVLAGDCSDGEKGAEVWRFVPASDDKSGDGTWTQVKSTNQEDGGSMGSNFLSSGISFSEQVDDDGSDTQVFFFGGMCPTDSGNATSWAKDASYTNVMLDLAPYGFGDDTEGFDISLVQSRAPPIPEAGFSITPLPPSFSSNSTGDNEQQQQDFVLLGGHTQQAFINMSQVALFSLPQQGWTFVPVTQPSSGKSDLARRADSSQVEPRSGHTTILSEDGNSLILFGGWVGDVNTPATPQLAILELGAGYGGSGDWTWVVPSDTGDGLPSGAGIYGHGAALLPGGVMMVVGGYSISAPSSRRVKRDSQSSNSDVYFFNTTSRSFVSSYQPPDSIKSESSSSGKKHKGSSSSKAGLGAGLGIGAAALIGLIVFYFWYNRRMKRAREGREQEMLGEQPNTAYNGDTAYNGGSQQPFLNGDSEKGPYGAWDGPTPPISPHRQQMDQFDEQRDHAPASGAYVDFPSPTRGLRKPPAGRGYQYHAAPKYDEKGSPVRGGIHSIAEHENEDGHDSRLAERGHAMLSNAERKLLELQTVLHHDPFSDHNNPLRSHPVSPHDFGPDAAVGAAALRVPPQQQAARNSKTPVAELEDTSSWQVEPLFTPDLPRDGMGGRVSPTKASERTSSTLSDASIYSAGSLQRTMSTRTGAILQAAAARMTAGKSFDSGTEEYFSPRSVPPRDNSQSPPRHPMGPRSDTKSPSYPSSHTRTSTNGSSRHGRAPGSSGSDVESFSTAKSGNFVHLQNEGQALLSSGGRHVGEYDDHDQTTPTATRGRGTYTLPAISQSTRRRGPADIFGSLRRALNVVSMGERTASQTQDPFTDAARASASPSPTKSYGSHSTPRRTTSDGGGGRLLSQKRGKKDWEENQRDGNRYRDDPDPGDWGDSPARTSAERRHDAEEDWDVEDAANKRDVQVMFSVPKARLRVVNDDMDRASLRSAPSARSGGAPSMRSVSDGGISRSDSLHSDYSQHNRMDTYRRGTPLGQQRSDASLQVQEELRRAPSSAYTLRSRTTATGEHDSSTWGGSSMGVGSLLDSRVEDYYDDKRAVFGSALGKSKGA